MSLAILKSYTWSNSEAVKRGITCNKVTVRWHHWLSNIIDYSNLENNTKLYIYIYRMCPKIKAKQTLSWSMRGVQSFGFFYIPNHWRVYSFIISFRSLKDFGHKCMISGIAPIPTEAFHSITTKLSVKYFKSYSQYPFKTYTQSVHSHG